MSVSFLAGGGEMGERIRAFPWEITSLGPPAEWPRGLRTAVRIMLTTQHPMFIFWGPDHVGLYNDAYSCSLGPEKHPAILGSRGIDAWAEIWGDISPQIDHVMAGKGATWHKDQLLPILRHGGLQEVYWTYSYSPIDEPESPHNVGGVLVICTETSENVLAERRLSEERERFVQLFEQAPTFLAVLEGPDHVIKLANPGYLKLVSGREVVGRRVADALPEAEAQGFVKLLDRVYATGVSFSAFGAKYSIQAAPGAPPDERSLDFVYQPMTSPAGEVTGILVQGVDVTARALSERALALSRSRLDYTTRLSGVGFWYCDLPFDVLEWDDRVKDHFFFPPEARITIEDFYDRIHEDDREPTRQAIQTSVATRAPYDIVYRTVDPASGAVKWIRALGGTDYADDGTPTHFDGVTVDVTAQELVQQRLSRLNHQLREQDRLKDQFIATLSHELRNPLAPIRAAAKVMGSPHSTPAQLQRAQLIVERQVSHMALLLDDLLDVARITQGKLQIRPRAVSLSDAVDAALEAVRPALDGRQQRLALAMPQEPVWVNADPVRLSQILSNLLTNAGKYSPHGSQVELAVTVDPAAVRLSVRDHGIGIAPESLHGIFDMFAQIDSGTSMSEGGLGIGLALVKGLTELHGGTVQAQSDGLGHGSEFILQLPLLDGLAGASKPAAHAPPSEAARRKILIADDNVDAAEALAMALEMSGHDVRMVHLGRSAVSLAESFRPDTAVLDIGMPDISGNEVARLLRAEPWGQRMQLIALTGWGQEADRRKAMAAGFDLHLIKPVDPDELERLILGASKPPAAV